MDEFTRSGRRQGASIGVLIIAVLVLVSPLRALWAHAGAAWYAPTVLWAIIVLLAACVAGLGERPGG